MLIGNTVRQVPHTGVIYVMQEAAKLGYTRDSLEWSNLGQGQAESRTFPNCTNRDYTLNLNQGLHEYAPVGGLWELREEVASYYNKHYRNGLRSKYSAENVAIAPGGRAALSRLAASLNQLNLGHFLPDYTAYEEVLDLFKSFHPIPIPLEAEKKYSFSCEDLKKEISARGLSALLFSNPSNPTGKLISGSTLLNWVKLCVENHCTLICDEVYSHYIWTKKASSTNKVKRVSTAEFVEDVEKDQVVIIDGLTKNWRLPGWRIAWLVGPKKVIHSTQSTGSFLDGGANHPLQNLAIKLLKKENHESNFKEMQTIFLKKRNYMIERLEHMGFSIEYKPEGGFYIWASVEHLPETVNSGFKFFKKALSHRVITVPGEFFDINPGRRREGIHHRFKNYVRFSFGPSMQIIEKGLESLSFMLKQ